MGSLSFDEIRARLQNDGTCQKEQLQCLYLRALLLVHPKESLGREHLKGKILA